MKSLWLYKNRTTRRLVVVSGLSVILVIAFGVSFVLAQEEGRTFLPWNTQSSGASGMTGEGLILRGLVGQSVMGEAESDEDSERDRFAVTLGFQTGVIAGPPAFAERVRELALTPLPPTSTPAPTATAAPAETATPTQAPATATAEPTATATAMAQADTPTAVPDTATPTRVPPSPTATNTAVPPTAAPTLTPSPTATQVLAVATSQPTATAVPEPPTSTPTPVVLFVTATPDPNAPPPEPPETGGVCSAPSGHGPVPLDLGMVLMLVAPVLLWRFGLRS